MTAHRSRERVMADILRVAYQPVNLTSLMIRANVSYVGLLEKLETLKKKGYLEEFPPEGNERVFHTTNEGRTALNLFSSAQLVFT